MKNELDIALDNALLKYREHFGTNYPLAFGKHCPSAEVIIHSVEKYIAENKPMPEPVYRPDCDY